MSRKHFEIVAAAMRMMRPTQSSTTDANKWHEVVIDLANALSKANPAFDRTKFLAACNA